MKTSAKARREGKFILDLFQIYTSNPMVILQQEEAKEFLSTTSPAGFRICIHYIRILIQHSQFFLDQDPQKPEERGSSFLTAAPREITASQSGGRGDRRGQAGCGSCDSQGPRPADWPGDKVMTDQEMVTRLTMELKARQELKKKKQKIQ